MGHNGFFCNQQIYHSPSSWDYQLLHTLQLKSCKKELRTSSLPLGRSLFWLLQKSQSQKKNKVTFLINYSNIFFIMWQLASPASLLTATNNLKLATWKSKGTKSIKRKETTVVSAYRQTNQQNRTKTPEINFCMCS